MSFRRLAICLLLGVLPLSRSPLAADELPAWTPIGACCASTRAGAEAVPQHQFLAGDERSL